jgi:hypothetical protein
MKELCVVHLVRSLNGIEPFERFLESYRLNPGGIEHDLIIVFKGFRLPQDTAEYDELLVPFRHTTLSISDEGFDITAYFAATCRYKRRYRYFCFLNSYSVLLDPDWLRKLYEALCSPGVGLVGATGSWISHRASAFVYIRNVLVGRRHQTRVTSGEVRSFWKMIRFKMEAWRRTFFYVTHFELYPNYHIRTNAFMISGALIQSCKCPIKTKSDAYMFESGKTGLTKRILATGRKVLVVGKDGRGYEKEAWRDSKTFFQSDQENLLVADNQTLEYKYGSTERRRYLSSVAWH